MPTVSTLRSLLPSVAALAALAITAASPAKADADLYEIDPDHFSIVFNADHIEYGAAWGMFLEGSGQFKFDEDARTLSDLSVTIEAASVFTNHDGRDDHLRSDDFLHAGAHPQITFEMTEAVPETETTGKVIGDLTLRGETHPVTLDVTLNKTGPYPWGNNYVVGITAKTTLKRSEWGMTYALEDNLVGNEVPIVIELEAIRQSDGESADAG